MKDKLSEFRGKLAALQSVDIGGEKEALEMMMHKLFGLQHQHQSLLDWSEKNKHMSAAWRGSVERSLHELGRSITANDAELSNERVREQVAVTQELRHMSSGVKNQMAKSMADE